MYEERCERGKRRGKGERVDGRMRNVGKNNELREGRRNKGWGKVGEG